MRTLRIKIVNSFTREPFSGNPAGVVFGGKDLTEAEMKLIARELNTPETAFILPATLKSADLQVRWFSPSAEVPLCGHATVAAFHALAEEGMEGLNTNGQHYFKLQTKSGILPIRVEKNFYGTAVEMELPAPRFRTCKNISAKLLISLGLKIKDLHADLPVVLDRYMFLPVKKLKVIIGLEPDFSSLKKELHAYRAAGVCVFSLETKEKGSAVHSRFFAPGYGINEDPVTGSSNGPLGCYLHNYASGRTSQRELPDGRLEFIGEQGDAIDRKGRVKVRIHVMGKQVESVSIAGEAVTIMNTELRI
jgi:PhzF family phenazine biosynthesis protein